jgi:cation transport ATPase
VISLTLHVQGMDSIRDLVAVEEALLSQDGVQRVEVFASKQVVDVYGVAIDGETLCQHLRSKGFPCSLPLLGDLGSLSSLNPLLSSQHQHHQQQKPLLEQQQEPRQKAFLSLDLKRVTKQHNIQRVMDTLSRISGLDTHLDIPRNLLLVMYNDAHMSRQHLVDILAEKQLAACIETNQDSNSINCNTNNCNINNNSNNPNSFDDSTHSRAGGSGRREYVYSIGGMSCGACAAKIEKSWLSMPGVVESAVSVMTHQGRAVIDDSPDNTTGTTTPSGPRDLLERARSLGYECSLLSSGDGAMSASKSGIGQDMQEQELQQWRRLLALSLVFGLPVLLLHFGEHVSMTLMELLETPAVCGEGVAWGQLLMLIFNVPILLFVGFKFYRNAFIGAMHGNFGMDFLVTTGTSITFIYSVLALGVACVRQEHTTHVFFETTGMLLMFVTIGKYIEAYAKGKSASSIAELLKLQPTEVSVAHCV